MAIRISVPSCACGMAGWGCFVEKFTFGSWDWKGWKGPTYSEVPVAGNDGLVNTALQGEKVMPLPGKEGGWELICWLVDPTHTMDSTVSAENQCPQYTEY